MADADRIEGRLMIDELRTPTPEPDHPTGHELSDVNTRALLTFLAVMMAALTIVSAVVYWQYRRFERLAKANDPPPAPRAGERKPPAPPLLQVDEPADMARMLAEQEPILSQLNWISQDDKIVRIPIERAMEIVATRGVPEWADTSASPEAPSAEPDGGETPQP